MTAMFLGLLSRMGSRMQGELRPSMESAMYREIRLEGNGLAAPWTTVKVLRTPLVKYIIK